jgi:hypothetical protein
MFPVTGAGTSVIDMRVLMVGGTTVHCGDYRSWCERGVNQVTASQRTRWLRYADQAVWNVWHNTQAKWGTATIPWTGWATNDPSDNYYYSFLRATMLLGLAAKGEDSQADAWITQFHDTKVMSQLVPEFNTDLVGGGSREGTGYGVAMRRLFELYDLWQSTTGRPSAGRRIPGNRCWRCCTSWSRPATASRRPAICRATRPRRSSTTTATTSRS